MGGHPTPTATAERAGRPRDRLERFAPRLRPRRINQTYSRLVGLLKVTLPAVALVIVALVVFWPKLQTEPEPVIDQTAAVQAVQNTGSMTRPRFFSTDGSSRPYSIIADRAEQASENAVIHLTRPEAEMTLEDGTWLALIADQGRYDQQGGQIFLRGSVNLFRDDGTEFLTNTAHIDLTAGNAWGDEPVAGHGPFGELIADGFRIDDTAGVIVFTGHSRLLLRDDEGEPG